MDGLKKIYSKVSADSADDLIFRNHALFELGQLYLEKCDFPNAVDCLEKVKTEALQFHLYDNYFKAISFLLRIHTERLDFNKQDSLIREVLQVGESLQKFDRYLPKILNNQGIACSYQKDFAGAKSYFEQSYEAIKKVMGNLEERSAAEKSSIVRDYLAIKLSLAVTQSDLGQKSESIEAGEKLLTEIDETLHGPNAIDGISLYDIEAGALLMIGISYNCLNEHERAMDYFWKAHGVLKIHRNWSYYYYVLLGLGRSYLGQGNSERAQIFFDLISDAISDLELNALKRALERVSKVGIRGENRLVIDRERKVIKEPTLGEVHFERRFVLLEILYLLAQNPGKVFSKEELVDKIWRENYNPMIHDSKVYTSISRLRKLIEPDFKRPIYILNERDGYTFNMAIQVEEGPQRLRTQQSREPIFKEKGTEL
ncbi:MAG: helix-turn-helix domain-containing protein [Oligoflexia bacterium]|nr:helix-turn-helix domain-containing protein [Oligoflexia bacterium]